MRYVPLSKKRIRLHISDHEISYVKRNRPYIQFDAAVGVKNVRRRVASFIDNPRLVASHQFLPVILHERKYSKLYTIENNSVKKLKKKPKVRPLVSVGHVDALIYSLYAAKLSEMYEKRVQQLNIEEVATAYRYGRSNITSSKEIMDIVSQDDCWILKGDFKGFFDHIDHSILKKRVSSLLNTTEGLSDDWYAVFKSVTKYRHVRYDDIPQSMLDYARTKRRYVDKLRDLGNAITTGELVVSSKHQIGIPQGTSISAVLANVYMMEFDLAMKQMAEKFGGVYRRYSDDFVMVFPCNQIKVDEAVNVKLDVSTLTTKMVRLTLESDKTKLIRYDKSRGKIWRLNDEGEYRQSVFDYLGFIFDGTQVVLRSKGLFKFNYKGKRSIRQTAHQQNEVKHDKLDLVSEYQSVYQIAARYYLNADGGTRSFKAYARNAQKIFDMNSSGNYVVSIEKQANRMIHKFQKYLHTRRGYYKVGI